METIIPEWQTERLRIRRLNPDDAAALVAIRSDGRVNRYINRPNQTNMVEVLTFIQHRNADMDQGDCFYWALGLKETDTLIGTTCLFRFNQERTEAEIGYELSPAYQGKGLMQEAVSKVLTFGLQELRLHAIHAYIHADNLASQKVVLKQHFQINPDKKSEENPDFQVFTRRQME